MEQHRYSAWADLVLYTAFAFATGLTIGLLASLASRPIGHETNWGSWADWVAALGAMLAALSTIFIAFIGQRAINRRRSAGRRVAESLVASLVITDIEKAIRVSRNPDVLKTVALVKMARDLYLHDAPMDDPSLSNLPDDVLAGLMSAVSLLGFLRKAADSLEAFDTDGRRKTLVRTFERFAVKLKPAAEYFTRDRSEVMPWHGWEARLDYTENNQRLLAKYHASKAD